MAVNMSHEKTMEIRAAIIRRDGNCCWYCGLPFVEDHIQLCSTIEHLLDRKYRGPDVVENLVLAHHKCNQRADGLRLWEKCAIRTNQNAQAQPIEVTE